jgi:hypothetical protein
MTRSDSYNVLVEIDVLTIPVIPAAMTRTIKLPMKSITQRMHTRKTDSVSQGTYVSNYDYPAA